MTEILRFPEQDVAIAMRAQLRFDLRNAAMEDAGLNNTAVAETLKDEIDQERRNVFVALGLESPEELDQLT